MQHGNYQLCVLDQAQGGVRVVYKDNSGEPLHPELPIPYDSAWSSDGTRIAFVQQSNDFSPPFCLLIIDAHCTNLTKVPTLPRQWPTLTGSRNSRGTT